MKANELQVYTRSSSIPSSQKFFWEGKGEGKGVKRVWYTHYVATFNRITTTSVSLIRLGSYATGYRTYPLCTAAMLARD